MFERGLNRMWLKIFAISLIVNCKWITADVSHLKPLSATINDNNHHFAVFNGYEYGPPALLPSPAPYPLPSTTFLPEIIVNRGKIVEIE